jgi:hypothetical protein
MACSAVAAVVRRAVYLELLAHCSRHKISQALFQMSRVTVLLLVIKFEQKCWIYKGKSHLCVMHLCTLLVLASNTRHKSQSVSHELQLPKASVTKILRNILITKPYKLQLVQPKKIWPHNNVREWKELAMDRRAWNDLSEKVKTEKGLQC